MNNDNQTITISQKEYEQLKSDNLYLRYQLEDLRRMIYGSKSERYVAEDSQLSLFDDLKNNSEQEPKQEEISYKRTKPNKDNKRPVRLQIASHLPRIKEIVEPEGITDDMRKIGEEITEILEYEAGKFYVRQIIRYKYVSKNPDEGVKIAELPSLPIPKGNAGAGLLSWLMVSKFVDHLPWYRQLEIAKRSGVIISDSTVNGWFQAVSKLLLPLYQSLREQVKTQNYLMVDETPIPVQDSNKPGATHTGYHWVYYSPLEKLVCFDYRRGRERAGPQLFLNNFKGALQTDGYAAYNSFETQQDITLLACMAHARRYFEKSLDNDSVRAQYMMTQFQRLYEIERTARENEYTHEQRYELRQKESVEVLKEMKTWLDVNLQQVLPKSAIGKAIQYSLSLWPRLIRYVDDGRFEIDNNLVENSIRPVALGRKNYLFAGSHDAAQSAAMMYSFFATCKRNSVDPYKWLKHALESIPEHKANRLTELLPNQFTDIFPLLK